MSDQHKLEQTFNEKGETVSPVLADGVKNFLIDMMEQSVMMFLMKNLKEWVRYFLILMH